MRGSFSDALEGVLRGYINLRIFSATLLLTILAFGLWKIEKDVDDQYYCKED